MSIIILCLNEFISFDERLLTFLLNNPKNIRRFESTFRCTNESYRFLKDLHDSFRSRSYKYAERNIYKG